VWSPYSPEQLQRRVSVVYDATVVGYSALVKQWFPTLAPRLRVCTTLPAHLRGWLKVPDDPEHYAGPVLEWYFDALADGPSQTTIELASTLPTLGDDTMSRQRYQRLLSLRPGAREWLPFTVRYEALDIFGAMPATGLAFDWLKGDLEAIGFE
jgi:hypothetical protein